MLLHVLVSVTQGKCVQSGGERPLGTPRRRWDDNNTVDILKELYAKAWTGLFWCGIGTGGGLL